MNQTDKTHTMKMTNAPWTLLLLANFASFTTQPAARAGDAPPPIKMENVHVRAVPPISKETAAFMVIVNDGDKPYRLVGGSTPIAGMTMPMVTTHEEHGGSMAMGMKDMPSLEVPAHGKLELKPDGDHLMLTDLKSTPKVGDKVKLTLRFEPGPFEITVEATVTKD
jgi:copper(I)-binding protein